MEFRKLSTWPIWFSLLVLLSLTTIVIISNLVYRDMQKQRHYDTGIFKLRHEGPDSAAKHYEKLAEIGNIESILGYAWAKQEDGDFGLAMDLSDLILKNTNDDHVMAKAHFMIGTILQRTDSQEKAIVTYKESEKYYSKIGSEKGRYLCFLRIAFSQVCLGDELNALSTLEHAKGIQPKNESQGQFKQIKSAALRNLQKWGESIPLALDALAHYRKDNRTRQTIDCLYEIAYQYALSRKPNKAVPYLDEAKALDTRNEHDFSNQITRLAMCLAFNGECTETLKRVDELSKDSLNRRNSRVLLLKHFKKEL